MIQKKTIVPDLNPSAKWVPVADKLITLLRQTSEDDFAQPWPQIQEYPSGLATLEIIWDGFEGIPNDQRTKIVYTVINMLGIQKAGFDPEQITLINSYTVPEATSLGLLPFEIMPVLRANDAVTLERCYDAMLALGGSKLFDPAKVVLRLRHKTHAENAKAELIKKLPASQEIWHIHRDYVMPNDDYEMDDED